MKRFDGFMHGVNLGGWFSQCDYSKHRLDTFITENDIKTISEWGLDHVRLPIDYNIIETAQGEPLEEGFERIARAFDWCKKYNLNVILDLHKTAGFSFDPGHKESGFFENTKYQERFYVLWERLANRFASYFDDSKNELCFELLNEVTDQSYCKTWNAIAKTCIEKIRAIAPKIKILVGSYWNNSLASVKDLDPPYDENIVYNFHCYDPLLFTHQGAGWIEKMDTSFRFRLNSDYKTYIELTEKYCGQKGTVFDGFDPDACLDEKYFEKIFAEAIEIADTRNTYLYCGEYGVIDRTNIPDTIRWYRYVADIFNRNGIGRAAWSYKEMDFGLADARLDDARKELLKYL